MTPLRFAPIIRVSTEEQERKGESLATQKTQISEYVKILGGTIPPECWQYSGQESATKRERILWDRLLADSGRNLFDAIIVADASRWSRNNQKSLEGLETLRANGIRFFIGTSEKNLNLPADRMTLGLFTTLNQFNAEEQSRKSQENRVHRAKRGIPTAGKLPYGRTWNKKAERWEVDPVKKNIIEQTARRYLAGESIRDIAKSFKVDASTLFKTLTQRCGTTWECRYRDKVTGITETVTLAIPRLLDEDIINAVRARMDKNITYVRGNRKHSYLLQGVIFCRRCGFKMSSYRNQQGNRYYRHSQYNPECYYSKFVRADEIETAVLLSLVRTFGDDEKVQRAILQATPDVNRRVELIKEHTQLLQEIRKIATQKEKIIDAIAEGVITTDDAKSNIEKLKQRTEVLQTRATTIEQELSAIPDPTNVKRISQWTAKVIKDATKNNPGIIFKRSYDWKRRLVEKVFGVANHNHSQYGVFVDWDGTKLTFEIRGMLDTTQGVLPMTEDEIADAFHVDPDSEEFNNIIKAWPRLNPFNYIIQGVL